MANLFQIGAVGNVTDNCGGLGSVVNIIKNGVLKTICILIPVALIAFGLFDLGKAVIASDEKEVKAAQSRFIKRIIYAIVIFLVPALVTFIMQIVALGADSSETSTTSWADCWNSLYIVNKSQILLILFYLDILNML